MLIPVVMAGGSGTRLWPLSRKLFPKQFLSIDSPNTMLQKTIERLKGLDVSEPITICNEQHRFVVAEQLRSIGTLGKIILEPCGKNTAPAVALSALLSSTIDDDHEDPLLLVLAADHVIEDEDMFRQAVKEGSSLAKAGKLVTFGVVPTKAHTGYGYIKKGEKINRKSNLVDMFVEKPSLEVAKQYIDSKEYLWNSGMFLFKASKYLKALERFEPEILTICKNSLLTSENDLDFIRIDNSVFSKCKAESIDYAVMEPLSIDNKDDVAVIPLDAGWSDVGSWDSLLELAEKNADGNFLQGEVICHNTKDSYIRSEGKLIAALGVENLVIVDTPDALLVSTVTASQDVKKIVDELKVRNLSQAVSHREVFRPWGKYDSIDIGARYQVKRITVKPGEKLSVQMHHHRAEHWIVVSGSAQVTNGNDSFLLTENQSTYIPIGAKHALENPGKIPLELIEIQSGGYLGEDDIVRFEDIYGRADKQNNQE